MTKITGDRYLAKALSAYDVDFFFHAPLITPGALRQMEAPEFGVKPIAAHAEKAAAYMADGYARATGKPGICGSQAIGRSNLLAGLRDAYLARSPVIALTGGSSPEFRYKGAYQELEDQAAFPTATKFNAVVERLDRLPDLLRQAFREATSGCPAPVHLEIAGMLGNISMGKMDDDETVEPRFAAAPSFRPAAETEDVKAVLAALASSERPLIVAGGGLIMSGAQEELKAFAQKHQIPVATSLNAKTAILDTHPLSVGVVGLYSKETANQAVYQADLVFYVGSMTAAQVTNNWTAPFPGKRVVQLDIDPHGIGRNYPNVASLCGDAKTVLQQLLDGSGPVTPKSEWLATIASIKSDWTEKYAQVKVSSAQPIRPERALTDLSEYLPDNAVVVCDTGHAGMWCAQFLDLKSDDQIFIRAAGSLGWGFPAALGAKCGHPDRPVFAFTGDGGFYYHFSELETAVRYGINTITIINNNASLNQETPVWGGAPDGMNFDHHWKFGDVNFANIAREMGAFGIRVTDPDQIKDALKQAQASGLPAIVELMVDIKALAPAPWAPEKVDFLLNAVGDATAKDQRE